MDGIGSLVASYTQCVLAGCWGAGGVPSLCSTPKNAPLPTHPMCFWA